MAGTLSLDAGLSGLYLNASHDAVEDVVGRPMAAVIHDQDIFLSELRLSAEIGIARGLGIGAMFPLRLLGTTILYRDAVTGEPLELVEPNIHHRDETLFGPADPWVTARYVTTASKLTFHLRLGVTLPLGRTEEDPFALGDAGLPHQHVQYGTGTFNLVLGAETVLALERFSFAAFLLTQQVLYENRKGYHAGDRYAAGLAAHSLLWTERFSFMLGVELQAETAERWDGDVPADDGNQGRVDLLAATAVTWLLSKTLNIRLDVKVPVFTHVVGGELRYPIVIGLSVGATFDLLGKAAGDDHGDDHHHGDGDDHGGGDHGHDHGDAHGSGSGPASEPASAPAVDWTGVDLIEIAKAGEAVDLLPVPGVVTVFDFWAPWCAPCRDLDEGMAELARGHPGRLAVRKLNVVDWDSPASARYLKAPPYGLPHVKVYGPAGELRLERTAEPAELLRAIGAILSELPTSK